MKLGPIAAALGGVVGSSLLGGGEVGKGLAMLSPIAMLLAKGKGKKKGAAAADPTAAPAAPGAAGILPPQAQATGLMAPRPKGFNLLSDDPNVRSRQRGLNNFIGGLF